MKKIIPYITILTLLFTAYGCAIKSEVSPVAMDTEIGKIYVQKNEKVHMEGLFDEIVTQLRLMGYQAEGIDGPVPADAEFLMTYSANWSWDMAMYLTYFQANLFHAEDLIGSTTYDAKMGGWRFDKFGKTADKIRAPLESLLANAKPQKFSTTEPTPMGDAE